MIYLWLFYEFFKTGLFSVGGGLATLPFLYEISDSTGWFTHSQLADMLAVSESTPGPIGVNMATFAGFTTGGVAGAVIATIGLILPSLLVILLIASFLEKFRTNRYVDAVFYGLRPASTALIAAAGVTAVGISLFHTEQFGTGDVSAWFNWPALALAAVLLLLTRVVKPTRKLHPIVFILASAIIGILYGAIG